jgi:hypothetical protein
MNEVEFSKEAQALKTGVYEHFKGKRYEVLGVASHSETLEELVIYKALYGKKLIWVRPLEMFLEKVGVHGKKQPRFRFINERSIRR